MKVANGKIVQITEGELYKIYIEREWDNLFSSLILWECSNKTERR